tara:strand:+ start:333 stop:1178 length:846 start_codon:yes stop_codon:yes gene_type:complete
MNKKIFWIASYPKSGNTWMRAIISSLFFTKDGIFDFKHLKSIRYFDRPENYKFVESIDTKDYEDLKNLKVISRYWTEAQKNASIIDGDFAFFKTHNANIEVDNYKYTNEENTMGLIYLVRDPRDVAVSYAKHKGINIDEIIEIITNEKTITFSGDSYPVLLTTWDHHYFSWSSLSVPKMIIKFEDLVQNTEEIIIKIINFFIDNFNCRFNNINTKLQNILKTTSFENLKNNEKKYGFSESRKNTLFFRKGEIKQWEKELDYLQIKKIDRSFNKAMKKLSYL